MAIKAISDFSPTWFIPDDQAGEKSPAQFKIKQLNGIQAAEVFAELKMINDVDASLSAEGVRLAIRYCLVGWDGIEGEGGPVVFSQDKLKYLPGHYHPQIAGAIVSKSNLSEDEAKK